MVTSASYFNSTLVRLALDEKNLFKQTSFKFQFYISTISTLATQLQQISQ